MQLTHSSAPLPKRSLLPEESEILNLKYSALRFAGMNMEAIAIQADLLLLKIHTITGWKMPDARLMKILTEEFTIYLRSKLVNANEVEHAFRLYSSRIDKEFGTSLSIMLISQVMEQYFDVRYSISCIEEEIKKPDINPRIDYAGSEWRGLIQESLSKYLEGQPCEFRLMPPEYYDQLVYDNFIPMFSYEEFKERARVYLCGKLQLELSQMQIFQHDFESSIGKYKDSQAIERKLIEYRNGSRDAEIMLLAKQMCVKHCFQYWRTIDIREIYKQES